MHETSVGATGLIRFGPRQDPNVSCIVSQPGCAFCNSKTGSCAEQLWSMSWPHCIVMAALSWCHCHDVVLIAFVLQGLSSLPFLLTSQFCKLPLLPWASRRAFCSVMPCPWDQVQAPRALAETPQLRASWTTFRCQLGQGSNSPAEILVGSAKPYLPYP